MKKLTILIIILALVTGSGWFLFGKTKKHKSFGSQSVIVTEGTISQTVEATGFVSPLNRVEIRPPMSGRIEKLLVNEGDRVVDGQILAWMSSSDRAAILDAARSRGLEELKRWEDDYKPTPIVAPLSGVIILKNVVVGQTVDPSAVVYAMSDFLIVLAQVDESDIGNVFKEMTARITLDAYPNQSIEGKVFDLLYEGKNVSNVITYGVKVKMKKVPSFFRSQMTANISFIIKSKDKAVLVPVSVVKDMPNGTKQVTVPGPNGKPVAKEVTTGIESNDKIEITSGLEPGDKVLITRARYTPQQGVQSSPLAIGGSRPAGSGGQGQRSR
ncbi:MAG: efflux RND transporter periplasmic adaptor subunit [Elusimicrobia bacterium]|nr:efflux RND transporter periplasmic adaptor subunit [Candidatus Liberimonas magnetica]